MKKKYNILITTSGSVTAQCVIKALRYQKEYKVNIITTDITDVTAGKYMGDTFYLFPNERKEKEYMERVFNVIEKEKIDIIVPIHDNELALLSKNKKEIERATSAHVFLSDSETIKTCNDKRLTNDFFKKHNISIPRVFSQKELENPTVLPYPLFIKPSRGVSAIDTYKIENSEALNFYLKKVKDPIVQECIEGKEYSIDAYMNLQGEFVNAIPRQRVAIRGGASFIGQSIRRMDMIETVKKICEKLSIIGPANIQCFERNSKEGPLYFEVNPRFSAAHIFSIKSGMNSVLYMLQEFDGKRVKPSIGKMKEICALRYWQEIFIDEHGRKLQSYSIFDR